MSVERAPSRKRSVVKALTYRVIILCLDFIVIYVLTRKAEIAAGFMIVSNVYTTVGYFLHERLWAGVKWGLTATAPTAKPDS
jgi:uncharacterized membrane protein